jgi:hypothetical protein
LADVEKVGREYIVSSPMLPCPQCAPQLLVTAA